MKYTTLLISSIFGLLFASCSDPSDPSDPIPLAATAASIDAPIVIGNLPDGRQIKCFVRDMGSNQHNHYIYYVGDTVTTNQTVKQGKTSYNQVIVEIDGVKYVPLENNKP